MAFGGALVVIALSLFVWNQYKSDQAKLAADRTLEMMLRQLNESVMTDPYDPTMKEVIIDGYAYVGYLSIPKLGLELPIMSECDLGRLRIAACRYSGSVKTDNMVIAAHNYTRHFGRLTRLSAGDPIYFTDMNKIRYTYEVDAIEVLSPFAVDEMTAGEYDLTLFTCTYGGANRITVRCERVKEPSAHK